MLHFNFVLINKEQYVFLFFVAALSGNGEVAAAPRAEALSHKMEDVC